MAASDLPGKMQPGNRRASLAGRTERSRRRGCGKSGLLLCQGPVQRVTGLETVAEEYRGHLVGAGIGQTVARLEIDIAVGDALGKIGATVDGSGAGSGQVQIPGRGILEPGERSAGDVGGESCGATVTGQQIVARQSVHWRL